MQFDVSAFDYVTFADEADSNIKVEALGDALNFNESVSSNFIYCQIFDFFPIADSASPGASTHQTLSDTLTFSDVTVPRVLYLEINDLLFITDVLSQPLGGVIREQLGLTDVAIMSVSKATQTDILTFTEVINVKNLAVRTISESLPLSDSLAVVLVNRIALDIPGGIVPVGTPPGFTVTLTDSVETLTLSSPDFNDSDSVAYKRINKDTMGYTRIIAGVAGWTPKKAKKMTFSFLTEREVNQIRAFWKRNVGRPVTFVDMYGNSITAILQNPEFESAQVGPENRTVSMDFYVL